MYTFTYWRYFSILVIQAQPSEGMYNIAMSLSICLMMYAYHNLLELLANPLGTKPNLLKIWATLAESNSLSRVVCVKHYLLELLSNPFDPGPIF